MTKIVQKRLPNAISVADVTDSTVRQKLMLANQNIAVLMSQLEEAQKAIIELQRKGGGSSGAGGSAADVKTVVDATLQEKNIQDGAEPNVQGDWAQTDTTADDYIKNKPEIPQPTSQVNSDWNATSGVAKILNKPTTMSNPYALSLTPINAAGAPGSVVQYNGSSAKSLNVLTAHQDISTKITYPSGGNNDDVLMKNGTSVKWGSVISSTCIKSVQYSVATQGNVTYSSSQSISHNVAQAGYNPIAVCGIACYGRNTGDRVSERASFACTSISISGNTVSMTINEILNATGHTVQDQIVDVSFFVLYEKT